jgi:putative ABC transport system permease protein
MDSQAIGQVFRDVCYALRTLGQKPTFAIVTILTMALGIAASTAVFSVVSAVLLKPLPYPDPDRIVLLVHTFQGRMFPTVSLPRLAAWRANTDAVQDVAVFTADGWANVSHGDARSQVPSRRATASFFTLFGGAARVATDWHRGADRSKPDGRMAHRVARLFHRAADADPARARDPRA